jgi:alpha-glucosidase
VWGWLSEPTRQPYIDAEGRHVTQPWFFGQPIGGIPRYTAREFVDAVVRFTSGIPWRVRLGNMQPLDTHDTARFATNAAPGTIPVAVGLSMTMPGLPVVFAGDEFGLVGADGELSRTPIPWDAAGEPEIAERLTLYRDLVGLRRAHPVLATGGLRWLHVDDVSVAFIRESAEECVLVLAARGDVDVELPPGAVPKAAEAQARYGDATLAVAEDGSVLVSTEGPMFAAWLLPGVSVPSEPPPPAHEEPWRDVVDGATPTPADIVSRDTEAG